MARISNIFEIIWRGRKFAVGESTRKAQIESQKFVIHRDDYTDIYTYGWLLHVK